MTFFCVSVHFCVSVQGAASYEKDTEGRIHIRPAVCTYGHNCVSAQHTEHINSVSLAYLDLRIRRGRGGVRMVKIT